MAKKDVNSGKKRILIVEDEQPLQQAIRIKLKTTSFEGLFVSSAEEAFELISKETVDLIWLDILLPGMDGLAFLEKIRQYPKWKSLPVVVISVSGGPEKMKQAFNLKANDYLVKSDYRLEDLIVRVSAILLGKQKLPTKKYPKLKI